MSKFDIVEKPKNSVLHAAQKIIDPFLSGQQTAVHRLHVAVVQQDQSMDFSFEPLGSPSPATPKSTWFSATHLAILRTLLRCIQNASKPALRAAEFEFPPTSRNQEFEDSMDQVLKTSKAPYTEVSERDFSRSDSKEASKPETKGAVA